MDGKKYDMAVPRKGSRFANISIDSESNLGLAVKAAGRETAKTTAHTGALSC